MSDAWWDSFFKMLTPVMLAIVTGWFARKLNHITKLANSMLSHQVEKKEEVEKKLEQTKADELVILRTQLAEANRTIALMTKPLKD